MSMSEDTIAYNARKATKGVYANRANLAEQQKRARWAADAEAERVANGYAGPPASVLGTRSRARTRARTRSRTRARTRTRARSRTGGRK